MRKADRQKEVLRRSLRRVLGSSIDKLRVKLEHDELSTTQLLTLAEIAARFGVGTEQAMDKRVRVDARRFVIRVPAAVDPQRLLGVEVPASDLPGLPPESPGMFGARSLPTWRGAANPSGNRTPPEGSASDRDKGQDTDPHP